MNNAYSGPGISVNYSAGCSGKVKHRDHVSAEIEAARMTELHRRDFSVYRCGCGYHHVGGSRGQNR